MSEEIIALLENVVCSAWLDEKIFHKKIFNNELEDNANVCQGMSRNIHHRLIGCFQDCYMVVFEVEKKKHIVVAVKYAGETYVIDSTIRQFRLLEERRVFELNDYLFEEQFLKGERRLS